MTAGEKEETVRDWSERLDRADALFAQGNITGAAALAHAVEDEVEQRRRRGGLESTQRRDCMAVLKRARATLDKFEFAAGIDDDDEDDES